MPARLSPHAVAATHLLSENGFIELPRRVMSRTATGFSAQGYEVWVEEPAERRAVRGARLLDRATAELTLDDGRKLLVDLTGRREPSSEFDGQAVVTISLSDPELAMLSPAEIRARLRILPDIHWCAHWNDRALAAKGDAAASQAACDALDNWSAEDEADFRAHLSPDIDEDIARNLRRETLLHRRSKLFSNVSNESRRRGSMSQSRGIRPTSSAETGNPILCG
jgi:hypothetical protein